MTDNDRGAMDQQIRDAAYRKRHGEDDTARRLFSIFGVLGGVPQLPERPTANPPMPVPGAGDLSGTIIA
jgi:hypothetical protein